MTIPGFYDESFIPPAPFINSVLESKTLQISSPVKLHIDTGASVTMLLDNDVKRLAIDVRKLPRTERPLTGIGGAVDAYVIRDGTLLFITDEGSTVEARLPIYVAYHRMARLKPEVRQLIMRLPSLLGRDLINRYKLLCDGVNKEVTLESP